LFVHKEPDKDENAKKIQAPFRKALGDEKERREKSIERLEKKLKRLSTFLAAAGPGKGSSGGEAQPDITGNESAGIKGTHGYIQGYNGIAIADSGNQVIISAYAIGSGSESGCFPEMLGNLEETMKTAAGKKKPLGEALLEGDAGYFSEKSLQEAKKRNTGVLIPGQQFRQRDPYFAGKKKERAEKKKFAVEGFGCNKDTGCYDLPCLEGTGI
jgi:hypothetical protein